MERITKMWELWNSIKRENIPTIEFQEDHENTKMLKSTLKQIATNFPNTEKRTKSRSRNVNLQSETTQLDQSASVTTSLILASHTS